MNVKDFEEDNNIVINADSEKKAKKLLFEKSTDYQATIVGQLNKGSLSELARISGVSLLHLACCAQYCRPLPGRTTKDLSIIIWNLQRIQKEKLEPLNKLIFTFRGREYTYGTFQLGYNILWEKAMNFEFHLMSERELDAWIPAEMHTFDYSMIDYRGMEVFEWNGDKGLFKDIAKKYSKVPYVTARARLFAGKKLGYCLGLDEDSSHYKSGNTESPKVSAKNALKQQLSGK